MVVWDRRMLCLDLGRNHPLHPLRWELTWLLAETLDIIDDFDECRSRQMSTPSQGGLCTHDGHPVEPPHPTDLPRQSSTPVLGRPPHA